MPAYFDTGFSVRLPMWHGLGDVLDDYPADWPEARKLAGLEWEPETRPMVEVRCGECARVLDAGDIEARTCGRCLSTDVRVELVEGEARVIRNDTGLHLGSVTDQFSPVTHEQMGEVMEALADSDSAVRFETAGSIRDGRQVWALAYLDEPIEVAGDDSATLPFLAVLNAHDGSGALKVVPTSIRVVCWNTYRAAEMQGERTGQQFVFRHVGNIAERLEDAKLAIKGVRQAHREWVELAEQLAQFKTDDKAVANFITSFIPEPVEDVVSDRVRSNIDQARAALRNVIVNEPTTDGHRGTVLGLVDGAVEYLDHVRAFRSRDTLMNRTLLRPEPLKAKVIGLALAAAGASLS
jgi:phage/plasmid-like protein (TIGR03299 family)